MVERVIRVVQAFAGGVVIAALATVVHGEWSPWVLIAALATVSSYLIALRILWEDRMIALSGAIAIVVTVFIFAQQSTGGSVLIQANLPGNVWVFGTAVIAGLASAWPEISFRARD
jgi:hypothetical protein